MVCVTGAFLGTQLDTILRLHEDEAAERARHREESFDASILRPQEPPAPVVNRRQVWPQPPRNAERCASQEILLLGLCKGAAAIVPLFD